MCNDVGKGTLSIPYEYGKTKSILATLIIRGSQQDNVGRVPGPMVMECDETEEHGTDLRRCNLLCQCTCAHVCGFLHFLDFEGIVMNINNVDI